MRERERQREMESEDKEHEEKTTRGCQRWRNRERQGLQGWDTESEIQGKVFRLKGKVGGKSQQMQRV